MTPAILPMMTLALSTPDWVVMALYAGLLVGTGLWFARRPEDAESYFLGGRRMPAWAVAISTVATSLSAATFVAAPDQAYRGDLTYLIATLGGIAASVIVSIVFLPVLYARGVTTVYQLLGQRFGPPAQKTGGGMFLLGRVGASGARVYIAAHALAFIAFGDLSSASLVLSVWTLVVVGVVYTVFGGIRTVIWTDVIQTVIFLGAVVVAVVHLAMNMGVSAGGAMEILRTSEGGSKLRVLSLSLDPTETYTLWTALIGFTLLNVGAYGTDQDLAQRLLTCKSKAHAARSLIGAVLAGLPVTALFMGFGLLLYVQDATSGRGASEAGVASMMRYITGDAHVAIPAGVGGIMIAGLFASGLSSLDSALNAMSSSMMNDFRGTRPGPRDDRRTIARSRLGVCLSAVVLGLFASACVFIREGSGESLIDFALRVMVFAYAGLVGVFASALLTRRGSASSAVASMFTGLAVIVLLTINPLGILPDAIATLAFPWQLAIGATIAFFVCVSAKGRTTRDDEA